MTWTLFITQNKNKNDISQIHIYATHINLWRMRVITSFFSLSVHKNVCKKKKMSFACWFVVVFSPLKSFPLWLSQKYIQKLLFLDFYCFYIEIMEWGCTIEKCICFRIINRICDESAYKKDVVFKVFFRWIWTQNLDLAQKPGVNNFFL